jgi:hypothetical protein
MLALLAILLLQPGNTRGAVPTTPGLGDTGPLARDLGRESRTPDTQGFSRVFELPRRPGQPRRFARVDGGLIAVFPASNYEETEEGPVATVPAGTVYYVGSGWMAQLMLQQLPAGAGGVLAAPTGVDMSSNPARSNAVDPTRPAPRTEDGRSIWTDETYRRERLTALLRAR